MSAVETKILRKLDKLIDEVKKNSQITEAEACQLLDISKATIQVYVSKGTIPASAYTVGIGGKRFYYRDKLMNKELA